jgi:predicted Fe-Mo cluster-binding NifX family protein
LFDVDEATKAIVKREVIPSPGHQPGFLPAWLAEEGISVVIASGMGSRAQALFRENRIEVIVGALGGDPEKAVLDYLRGTLATGDNICDH